MHIEPGVADLSTDQLLSLFHAIGNRVACNELDSGDRRDAPLVLKVEPQRRSETVKALVVDRELAEVAPDEVLRVLQVRREHGGELDIRIA